VKQAIVLR